MSPKCCELDTGYYMWSILEKNHKLTAAIFGLPTIVTLISDLSATLCAQNLHFAFFLGFLARGSI